MTLQGRQNHSRGWAVVPCCLLQATGRQGILWWMVAMIFVEYWDIGVGRSCTIAHRPSRHFRWVVATHGVMVISISCSGEFI